MPCVCMGVTECSRRHGLKTGGGRAGSYARRALNKSGMITPRRFAEFGTR